MLSRREHSAAELSRKLVQKGFEPPVVADVVARLIDTDLLSEDRYAENLARSRARKGYGPQRIQAELQESRVPDGLIQQAISDLDWDFVAAADAARLARFGSAPPKDARDFQRQYQFLARRGFEPEQIRAALRDRPDDLS